MREANSFRTGVRHQVETHQPVACFIEQELEADGEIASGVAMLLAGRECPWRCVYCDLWKHTLTRPTPPGAIPEQIDRALARLQPAADDWHRIKLYNAGSFFDPGAIPPEDHPAIAARARRFERVIVECHPALVNETVLRFRDLVAPAQLEVAMGLETAHRQTLAKLNKGMTLEQFGRAADFLRRNSIAMRAFTLLQPPFLRDPAQAVLWSERTLNFAFDCGASVAVIIPTRGGNEAMDALVRVGQFVPPILATLETAMELGCGLRRGRVFADLWDLQRFSTCPQCFPARAERIRAMNNCQVVPSRMACGICGTE